MNYKKKLITDRKLITKELINYLETAIADEIILSSFVRDLEILFISDTVVHIGLANKYGLNLLKTDYVQFFRSAVFSVFSRELQISFFIIDDYKIKGDNNKYEGELFSLLKKNPSDSFINKNYNFNNFVLGTFNKDIVGAGEKIILQKGFFNPMFFYSASGFGKTHFLHALGNKLIDNNFTVFYLTPERLTTEIKNALLSGGKNIELLKNKYQSADFLLIDDIQFLANREKTLDVLFDLFNKAIENKKQQLVISSDKNPNELGSFENRFITRFASGLILQISKPTTNDLIKIVKSKIKFSPVLSKRKWEDEAIAFLAKNNSNNIRFLQSSISRIEFLLDIIPPNALITLRVLKEMFKGVIIDESLITPERIIEVVSDYYSIKKNKIYSKTRIREVVLARHVAMWLIKKITKISYKNIGYLFGDRDHSTVISAIKKIDTMKKRNSSVSTALAIIENKIKRMN